MEKLKRHTLNGSSLEWVLASDVEALESANAVNEEVIRELEKNLRLRTMAHELDKLGLDKLWRERDSLQSQLTAEQQAHAETMRDLQEVDAELASLYTIWKMNEELEGDDFEIYRKAIARQASINRPTDKSPTDDRGEGEK